MIAVTWTYLVRTTLQTVEGEVLANFKEKDAVSFTAAKTEQLRKLIETVKWMCKTADDRT